MDDRLIFVPVLVQVLLTLFVYVALNVAKSRAARDGQVDEARRALHEDAWPDHVRQINNNIRNQFEVPVLFYVLAFMLWALQAAGPAAQVAAWGFVLSRMWHALVHTGSNRVPLRRRIFMFGCAMVFVLVALAAWALLAR
jgi:hypothetical protein